MTFDLLDKILKALQEQNNILQEQKMLFEKILKNIGGSNENLENREYLTVKEVAKNFKKTPKTIRNWIHSGKLKAIKLNKGVQQDQFYIHQRDVSMLLNN